jgi:hypothetical protein
MMLSLHYFYRPAEPNMLWAEEWDYMVEHKRICSVAVRLALIEAYTFMKGEADLVQNYTQRFTEALSRVKNFGESQEVTDAYRTGLILREKT